MPQKVVIGYFPVIHRGVVEFLNIYSPDHLIMVIGEDILKDLSVGEDGIQSLSRDPRILKEDDMVKSINPLLRKGSVVRVLRYQNIKLLKDVKNIVMPDEDVSRLFCKKYLKAFQESGVNVLFEPTFLRWDMLKTLSEVPPNCDRYIKRGELVGIDIFVDEVFKAADKSSDWWRQVAAIMVKDGQVVLTAWNHHMPHEYHPYILGDPRSNFDAGQHIELCSAGHAEATVVAEAAKRGMVTKGATLFVKVFPCPVCAKQIAQAGFGTLYFVEGYSRLESVEILKDAGVEIIHVEQ